MKWFFIIVMSLTISNSVAQESESLSWLTNLEEAKEIAKKEKKPILVYFTGSDWCAPCKSLKVDFFDSPKFKEQSTGLVLVMIDYPRRIDIISEEQMEYNKNIIEKYNTDKSFPKLVGLNHRGKEIAEISGYSPMRDTTYHFKFLEEVLQ